MTSRLQMVFMTTFLAVLGGMFLYVGAIGFYFNSSLGLNEKSLIKFENVIVKEQGQYTLKEARTTKTKDKKGRKTERYVPAEYATYFILEPTPQLKALLDQKNDGVYEDVYHFKFLSQNDYTDNKVTFYFNPNYHIKNQYFFQSIVMQDANAYGLFVEGNEVFPIIPSGYKWGFIALFVLGLLFTIPIFFTVISRLFGKSNRKTNKGKE